MRLVMVTNLFPRPDQSRRGLFNAQLFAALADQGVEITNLVFVPEWRLWRWQAMRTWRDPRSPSASTLYLPVFHLPLIGRNLAWRFHVRALRRHGALFESCDAIQATWLYPDATAAGIVARECGKPFWVKVHGTDRFHLEHPVRKPVILGAMQEAAGFLPNAQFLADYLAGHGIPPERIHVVRAGVDHARFCPRPSAAS